MSAFHEQYYGDKAISQAGEKSQVPDKIGGLSALFALALELNRKDFAVFVYFGGNTGGITVDCRPGGWQGGEGKKIVILEKYIDRLEPSDIGRARAALRYFSERNSEITFFLKSFDGENHARQ